jgi:membrane protease YdiL (CAAX protease family)
MQEYKFYKKDFSRIGFVYIIGTLAIYAVQFMLEWIISLVLPNLLSDVNILLIFSMVTTYLVGMPLIYLMMKDMPTVQIQKHKIKPWQFILAAIMSFALMYCANMVGTVITAVAGFLKGSAVETNAASQLAMSANMGLTFFFMVLCAPVIEELIFRKLIVDRTVKYGEGTAILLSGLMFGLFHGNLSQFAYAFVLGMFFAFIYIKTGQIKVTIGLHMIINFIGGIVSVLVLKMLDNSGFYDMTSGEYDPAAFTETIMSGNGGKLIAALMVILLYVFFVAAVVIAGVVMFIVFHKKFTLNKGEINLEKGHRFTTVILNPGMIIYCLFWIAMIIYQLLFV